MDLDWSWSCYSHEWRQGDMASGQGALWRDGTSIRCYTGSDRNTSATRISRITDFVHAGAPSVPWMMILSSNMVAAMFDTACQSRYLIQPCIESITMAYECDLTDST
jgi:hypothetical protein